MYDELVNSLRICGKMRSVEDYCVAFPDGCCEAEPACMYELMRNAADAIEELSAKATPKRVWFAGWRGCRNTRYRCPYCKKNVRNDEKYCHKCGQALMFPHISHTPYVPGEKQDVIVTWPDEQPKEE